MSASRVNVILGLSTKQFETELKKAQRSLAKVSKQMQDLGKSLSTYVTAPIVAMGYATVSAFDKQAKAIAQVEAGLRSTGGTVGYTSSELQKMASELQAISLFGDEEILQGVTAQLLTFTNITDEQFARTQQAALDLATRLDGDLKSASIQLGKALNDPVANLSALSRSGIQFSEEQKDLIESLWATGKQAEAQTVILNELEKQYGGSAEAAAAAGAGPIKQLSNSFGDLLEDIGEVVLNGITPFIEKLKGLVESFRGLSYEQRANIVQWAAILTAIGPAVLIIGKLVGVFGSLLGIIRSVTAAKVLLYAEIMLVVAAAIALAAGVVYLVKNWEALYERFVNFFKAVDNWVINGLVKLLQGLRDLAALVGWDVLGETIESMKGLKHETIENTKEIKSFGEVFGGLKDKIAGVVDKINIFGNTTKKVAAEVGQAVSDFSERIAVTGLDKMTSAIGRVRESLKGLKRELPEVRKQINIELNALPKEDAIADRFVRGAEQIENAVNQAVIASIAGTAAIIGEMMAMGGSFNDMAKNIGMLLLSTLGDLAVQVGQIAIATGLAVEGIKDALLSLNPIVAIAAGIALVALGSFVKGKLKNIGGETPTPFADGGIVSGATNALIGEYPGASSNPEVVAPLDKLTNIMAQSLQMLGVGNQMQMQPLAASEMVGNSRITVDVVGRIDGKDIYLSQKRYNNSINRTT